MTNKMPYDLKMGEALSVLKEMRGDMVHLTFTSPPYFNAKDYSQYPTYDDYINTMGNIFDEVHRVMQDGRFLIINTSPVIQPRKNRNDESIRYPIHMDMHARLKDKWAFIDDIIWAKPEPSVKNRNGGFYQHRKPVAYKPNNVAEYVMVYRKKTDKLIDHILKKYDKEIIEKSKVSDGYETSNLWHIRPEFNTMHPAVFPVELASKIIKYYSMVGDTVLDPFSGVASAGVAAIKNKRKYIGIEQNLTYHIAANQRLEKTAKEE